LALDAALSEVVSSEARSSYINKPYSIARTDRRTNIFALRR